MDTALSDERREFAWAVDPDDPARYVQEQPEPEEDTPEEEEVDPPPLPWHRRAHLGDLLGPLMLALAYVVVVSGVRWWSG